MNSATFPAAAVEGLAHVEISTHVIGKELTSLLHHHLSLIAVEGFNYKNKYYLFIYFINFQINNKLARKDHEVGAF